MNAAPAVTSQESTEQANSPSLIRRNAQRVAAVAFIVIAGPTAISSFAGAAPGSGAVMPAPEPTSEVAEYPAATIPTNTIPNPGDLEIEKLPNPTWTIPPGTEIPTVPGDTPEVTVPEYPDDTPTTTAPTYPEDPEVEDEQVGGAELAYTGNDSKLPLVGAGLVAVGGLVAGLSVLAKRSRLSQS